MLYSDNKFKRLLFFFKVWITMNNACEEVVLLSFITMIWTIAFEKLCDMWVKWHSAQMRYFSNIRHLILIKTSCIIYWIVVYLFSNSKSTDQSKFIKTIKSIVRLKVTIIYGSTTNLKVTAICGRIITVHI